MKNMENERIRKMKNMEEEDLARERKEGDMQTESGVKIEFKEENQQVNGNIQQVNGNMTKWWEKNKENVRARQRKVEKI